MEFEKEIYDLFLMQQAYGTLFSLTNKLQISGDDYLDSITMRQYMTIVAILHLQEEETTINNIARKLGTSKQNANRMVSSIEKQGFLKVIPSPKDKRATNVFLTEAGKKAVVECSKKAVNFMADAFKNFTTSELETFWTLLKKLYQFDGETQDGFEDEGLKLTDDMELEKSIIQNFADKRNSK